MREEQNMSKANQFLKEEDAVSPVIGVILMVAITVTLAAVIAAFVFGMGPPEQAPQASLRASADGNSTDKWIKLEHQGGDAINMGSAYTSVVVNGTTVGGLDTQFDAGETLYLSADNVSDSRPPVGSAISGTGTVSVKIIDVASQQMIADMSVRMA